MLISRIQSDLFEFIDKDPDEINGLVHLWYRANSNALSAALTKQDGLKLIVNISDFSEFENLSKKLFLVADTLILRDLRKRTEKEMLSGVFPEPIGNYISNYYEELKDELSNLKPSPLTLLDHPAQSYASSTTKKLNNGLHVWYTLQFSHCIPQEFINWITSTGRDYMKTGTIIYAPFIPPIDFELEFLKKNISLPAYFNATPCFHQNFEWLDEKSLHSLFSLRFPFIENIDIDTISKVKQDNYDEFKNFSSSILQSIEEIKGSFGTADFLKEVKYIQRNLIDDNVSSIEKKIKRIENITSLRKLGIITGLIGVNAAMYLGAGAASLSTGLSSTAIAMIMNKIAELNSMGDLKDNSSYFLWKLGQIK